MYESAGSSKELSYIICVDDEQSILNQLSVQLDTAFGEICSIECAESAAEALELMENIQAEGGNILLVISDQMMPEMTGDRFLEIVNEQYPDTRKVLLTGYAGLESAMYAINNAGLDKYLEKPWDKDAFIEMVRTVINSAARANIPEGSFRLRDAIQNVLIFRDFASEEIDLIAGKVKMVTFQKDAVIFNIEDPGDCLYIIKSGEIKVVAGMGSEGEVLAYLGRGSYFGEMALLTGEPRSASVVAVMDSELLVLTKEDFDYLLTTHPSIALTFSHVLSQRLRDLSMKKAGRHNKIVCLLNGLGSAYEKTIVIDLARRLCAETNGKVVIIDFDIADDHSSSFLPLDQQNTSARWILENLDTIQEQELNRLLPENEHGVKFFLPTVQDIPQLSAYITQLLSLFKEYYNFVLVNCTVRSGLNTDMIKTMEQADNILYLFEQSATFSAHDLQIFEDIRQRYVALLSKIDLVVARTTAAQSISPFLYHIAERHRIHLLRLDEEPVKFLFRPESQHAVPVNSTLNHAPLIAPDVSRIARRLGNVSVGLVLGGGGARAYAHLGVLKVLREEGIPIDSLAGTSMGAFLGALVIQGKTIDDILEITQENWKKLNSPISWTIPRISFIKGKRIRHLVHDIFGDVLIEDMPLPFFCVAADLVSGQEVVIDQGKLYEAILASGALPGFFEPVFRQNMYLVDGGVVNNVPGDVLKKQGMDIVIAVDVTPKREVHLMPTPNVVSDSHQNFLTRLWQSGKQLKQQYGTIVLPRIIMRVMAIEGLEITRNKAQYFDIHIRPNLEAFDLFDFRKLRQIIETGEQAGRQELPKIRETIEALKRSR